jgi:nicotinate-nucleotide pyrophosphorylase (carboxylating)
MTLPNKGVEPEDIESAVRRALVEDVGTGDLTADLINPDTQAAANLIAREDAVVCGQAWFDEVFRQLDARIGVAWQLRDGDAVNAGQMVCQVYGPARGILTGERTAINFLQFLSGIATHARRYAYAVRGTGAVVLDTRKTIPGLREAQKYAVTSGGCRNHRMGLYDEILIKDNHIQAAGSVSAAIQAAKQSSAARFQIEIEARSMEELREAISAGATRVLLDNFTIDQLRVAVKETAGRVKLEASGGASLDDIRRIAETGVNFISVGDLTKNISAIDFSMQFEVASKN